MLANAGFVADDRQVVVLLDVSSSMGTAYTNSDVQAALRQVLDREHVKVYRFNNGLVPGGDLTVGDAAHLHTSGGTELGRALTQLVDTVGTPHSVLVVTDGGHDHPDPDKWDIRSMRECPPRELGQLIQWLDTEALDD